MQVRRPILRSLAGAQLEPQGLGAYTVGTATSDANLLAAAQALNGASNLCAGANAIVRNFQASWNATTDTNLGAAYSPPGALTIDGLYSQLTASALLAALGGDPTTNTSPSGAIPAPCIFSSGGGGGGGGGSTTTTTTTSSSTVSTTPKYVPWLIGAAVVAAGAVTFAELKKHKRSRRR